jgi:N-acyl-D-amino-acid deacylase
MNSLLLLFASAAVGDVPADAAPAEIRKAITKGLGRIEQGAANYPKHRQCFSCHHQAVPIMALSSAKERGFAVSLEDLKKHVEFSLKSFDKLDAVRKGQAVGGANTTVAYALATLAVVEHPADETTQALVEFLLVRQRKDGAWPAVTNRPPTEGSLFTNAGLTLWTLEKYGKAAAVPAELRKRVDAALEKGKEWLADNEPATHEDRVFHLRALVHAGVDKDDIAAARDALVDSQLEDGSWAQLPEAKGDAYATGTALVALRIAGLDVAHPAYRKGTKYLLSTQKEDGAWLVETRSRPIQTFFDNGDPGGKSQFISMYATSWATLALLEHFPLRARKP